MVTKQKHKRTIEAIRVVTEIVRVTIEVINQDIAEYSRTTGLRSMIRQTEYGLYTRGIPCQPK